MDAAGAATGNDRPDPLPFEPTEGSERDEPGANELYDILKTMGNQGQTDEGWMKECWWSNVYVAGSSRLAILRSCTLLLSFYFEETTRYES